MPTRRKIKCGVRGAALALDSTVEWSLCFWKGLGVPGIGADEPSELAAAWTDYGEEVQAHFTASCPGMRPFAMFALGLITLPKAVAEPYPNDAPAQTKVGPIFESRVYGGYEGLYQHLLKLGLVDAEEQAAADALFNANQLRTPYESYQLLSEQILAQ